jgi:hypothetical protein
MKKAAKKTAKKSITKLSTYKKPMTKMSVSKSEKAMSPQDKFKAMIAAKKKAASAKKKK